MQADAQHISHKYLLLQHEARAAGGVELAQPVQLRLQRLPSGAGESGKQQLSRNNAQHQNNSMQGAVGRSWTVSSWPALISRSDNTAHWYVSQSCVDRCH